MGVNSRYPRKGVGGLAPPVGESRVVTGCQVGPVIRFICSTGIGLGHFIPPAPRPAFHHQESSQDDHQEAERQEAKRFRIRGLP